MYAFCFELRRTRGILIGFVISLLSTLTFAKSISIENSWDSCPAIDIPSSAGFVARPKDVLTYLSRDARMYEKERAYEAAVTKWQSLKVGYGDFPQIQYHASMHIADCLVQLKRIDAATSAVLRLQSDFLKYDDAILWEDGYPVSYHLFVVGEYGLGMFSEESGDLTSALAHYEKALANEKNITERIAAWPMVNLGKLSKEFRNQEMGQHADRNVLERAISNVRRKMSR